MSSISGDLQVKGTLTAYTMSVPNGSITNAKIAAPSVGDGISTTKLRHRHFLVWSQESTTVHAADDQFVVFRCHGATAELIAFYAGNVATNTGANDWVADVWKNGVSMLAAALTGVAANPAAYGSLSGAMGAGALSTMVAGDVMEMDIDVLGGGGNTDATGIFMVAVVDEDEA